MKLNNEICISFLRGSGWLYNHDKEITISERNKAIDDFLEVIDRTDREEPLVLDMYEIEEIAEQLKAGGENETYNQQRNHDKGPYARG